MRILPHIYLWTRMSSLNFTTHPASISSLFMFYSVHYVLFCVYIPLQKLLFHMRF